MFSRKGTTSEVRNWRNRALWKSGLRTLDGQQMIELAGQELDRARMKRYLEAKRHGLGGVADPEPWLVKSLKRDWLEGEVGGPRGVREAFGMSRKEERVAALVLLWGWSQSEVSRLLGVSRQNVSQTLERGLKRIRSYFEARNITKRGTPWDEALVEGTNQ